MGRKKCLYVPITWYQVPWRYGWNRPLNSLDHARTWCRTNIGMERADWEYQYQHGRFRFRKQEDAVMFRLTWC